jgi:hypothetical protein
MRPRVKRKARPKPRRKVGTIAWSRYTVSACVLIHVRAPTLVMAKRRQTSRPRPSSMGCSRLPRTRTRSCQRYRSASQGSQAAYTCRLTCAVCRRPRAAPAMCSRWGPVSPSYSTVGWICRAVWPSSHSGLSTASVPTPYTLRGSLAANLIVAIIDGCPQAALPTLQRSMRHRMSYCCSR